METKRSIGLWVDGAAQYVTDSFEDAEEKARKYLVEGKRVVVVGHRVATEDHPTMKKGQEYSAWIHALKLKYGDEHEKALYALDKKIYFMAKEFSR